MRQRITIFWWCITKKWVQNKNLWCITKCWVPITSACSPRPGTRTIANSGLYCNPQGHWVCLILYRDGLRSWRNLFECESSGATANFRSIPLQLTWIFWNDVEGRNRIWLVPLTHLPSPPTPPHPHVFKLRAVVVPRGGVSTYYFEKILPKIAWKWKKLDQEGACAPGAPWIRHY